MKKKLYKIFIFLVSGVVLSAAAKYGFEYTQNKIAPLDTRLLERIQNKYAPKFNSVHEDYNYRLHLLVEESKKAYYELNPAEPKTSLISIFLKKLNELERFSDDRFNSVWEEYKTELRQNHLPLDSVWVEKQKYQRYKREIKEKLYNKYQDRIKNITEKDL